MLVARLLYALLVLLELLSLYYLPSSPYPYPVLSFRSSDRLQEELTIANSDCVTQYKTAAEIANKALAAVVEATKSGAKVRYSDVGRFGCNSCNIRAC